MIHYIYFYVNCANNNHGGEIVEKKNKNEKKKPKLSPLVEAIIADWETASESDVLGSYTGNPEKDEMPVQDADDL